VSALRSVEEQQARVRAAVRAVGTESVPLAGAAGRVLAEPVRAAADLPPFDNSAMDGFAVRAADVAAASAASPAVVRVVADLPAGTADDPSLAPGEAARIMTGAPTPSDADAVVPFEDTAGGLADSLETAHVLRAPAPGAAIRRRGSDVRAGEIVVPAGTVLGAYQLAAVAAAGHHTVVVARRPRVAVVSTGSELVAPGEPIGRGQIPDSNGTLLAALVTDAGGELVLVERVADTADAVAAVVARALDARADVLVFSGGVSAGAYEPVRAAFEGGGDIEFAKVAMQPGKPQAFGTLPSGALVFGLPGNPVSVAVSFEVFVRPALAAMQGRDPQRALVPLRAATGWRTPPGRRQYLPAVVDLAAGTVAPATAGGSGSHLAGSLARATAWAIVPAEVEAVAAGDVVDVMLGA
jgi:molybdopterin molybdotransferase